MTESTPALRICIVCAGNICRSPIAEVVIRRHLETAGLGDLVAVESAGTGGWHIGDPADQRALDVLAQHGYDGTMHRARQFDAAWFARADLVLAMDRDNFARLHAGAPDDESRAKLQMLRAYDDTALAGDDTDIPDPYFGDSAGFALVLSMVESAAAGLVAAIRREIDDVPDAGGGEPGRR